MLPACDVACVGQRVRRKLGGADDGNRWEPAVEAARAEAIAPAAGRRHIALTINWTAWDTTGSAIETARGKQRQPLRTLA